MKFKDFLIENVDSDIEHLRQFLNDYDTASGVTDAIKKVAELKRKNIDLSGIISANVFANKIQKSIQRGFDDRFSVGFWHMLHSVRLVRALGLDIDVIKIINSHQVEIMRGFFDQMKSPVFKHREMIINIQELKEIGVEWPREFAAILKSMDRLEADSRVKKFGTKVKALRTMTDALEPGDAIGAEELSAALSKFLKQNKQ